MGVRRLNFINSIKELSSSTITIQNMRNGSVKAVVELNGKEATVSRNELIDEIERLVNESLGKNVTDDIQSDFEKLKEFINISESTKVKGVKAKLRRFFANLFKEKRNSRLDKISLLVEDYSQKQKLELEKRELEEKRELFAKRELLRTKAREELGFTQDEILTLEERGKLQEVIDQQERALKSAEVKSFFGTEDPKILGSLFAQNVLQPKSTFSIQSRQYKLRGNLITLKQEAGQGAATTVYKVHRLSINTFKTSSVARKRLKKRLEPNQILKQSNAMKNESRMLKRVADLIVSKNRPDLKAAFQEAPLEEKHKKIQGVDTLGLEGPLYESDLSQFLTKFKNENNANVLKADALLPAFDLLIQGIAFLQLYDVIHVDIKLENIYLKRHDDGSFRFLLGDFGEAYEYSDFKAYQHRYLSSSPAYTPFNEIPHMSKKEETLHQLSSFQLGSCLFFAFTNHMPYGTLPTRHNCVDLGNSNISVLENIQIKGMRNLPDAAIKLIKKLLDPDPAKRPIGQALLDEWDAAKRAMPEIPFGG